MIKEWPGYKKGINLGGWLSQCVHTYEHYDSFIKEEDLKTISSWGLDHVRIPVDYDLVEDKEGNYIEKGFEYIQKAIDWCKNSKLNMILDIHKTFGYSFDSGEKEDGFFVNEAYQERFYRLWEELAKRFGNYGDRVAFELLNEVTDQSYGPIWNAIAKKCIIRIRKIAPTTKILVGSYWNNAVSSVKDLDEPYDKNIIYNCHCYEPIIFTHQAAGWVDVMKPDFRISFKNTYKKYKEECGKLSQYWARDFFVPGSEDDVIDSSYFEGLFQSALATADKRDVALYCGEYGVIDIASNEDTLEWYKAINAVFQKYNIGRAAWSYRRMNFGLSDAKYDDIREELIKYL